MADLTNPLLDEVRRIPHALAVPWDARDDLRWLMNVEARIATRDLRTTLVWKYAWAIPNEDAIRALVARSPLVEIGAGTGYWAWLVQQAGGDVVCYDVNPRAESWTLVEKGGPERVRAHPDRTLFLCWPPYNTPMALKCLMAYRGSTLVYVGERDGCTGDRAFDERLDVEWRLVRTIHIPCWDGIHDRMMIFKRKSRRGRRR